MLSGARSPPSAAFEAFDGLFAQSDKALFISPNGSVLLDFLSEQAIAAYSTTSAEGLSVRSRSRLQGELQHHQPHRGNRLQRHLLHLGRKRRSQGKITANVNAVSPATPEGVFWLQRSSPTGSFLGFFRVFFVMTGIFLANRNLIGINGPVSVCIQQ